MGGGGGFFCSGSGAGLEGVEELTKGYGVEPCEHGIEAHVGADPWAGGFVADDGGYVGWLQLPEGYAVAESPDEGGGIIFGRVVGQRGLAVDSTECVEEGYVVPLLKLTPRGDAAADLGGEVVTPSIISAYPREAGVGLG